ncbi:MAG: histidine kinase [Clostridiaceae bacterium]
MIKFKNIRLSHQLYLLISFSICIIILVNSIFYVRLRNVMLERLRIYADDTISQLEFNMNNITEEIKKTGFSIAYNKFMQEYLITGISYRKLELSNYIVDAVENINGKSGYITDVAVIDKTGSMTVLKSSVMYSSTYNKLKEKYNFESEDLTKPFFSDFVDNGNSSQADYYFAYIVPVYYSGQDPEYSGRIGTTIIFCSAGKLSSLVEQMKISKSTVIELLDRNNKVIMSNNIRQQDTAIEEVSKKQGKYISITREIEDIGCRIECKTPLGEMSDDISFFINSLILTAVIMVILLALIGFIINISITSPVFKIVNAIGTVGEKNLKQRVNLKLQGEIGFIAQNINIMLDKIEQMTKRMFTTQERLYQLEILKTQAELSALQSQINPHFLYNTLECIRSIGIAFNIDEIVEISTAMADIFRYSIKGGDFVTVQDEMDIINMYFRIITIRFAGRFAIKADVNSEIMTHKIPKMVLQPIVENAVYHGLEQKDGTGTLSIRGVIENRNTIIIVEDDGVGITPDELERLNKLIDEQDGKGDLLMNKRSIGLANINSRIKIQFGREYGLKIESELHIGTRVTITFPEQL